MSIHDFNDRLHSAEPGDAQLEALRRLTKADRDRALVKAKGNGLWQAWYED